MFHTPAFVFVIKYSTHRTGPNCWCPSKFSSKYICICICNCICICIHQKMFHTSGAPVARDRTAPHGGARPSKVVQNVFVILLVFVFVFVFVIVFSFVFVKKCHTHQAPQSRGTELPHTVVLVRQKLPKQSKTIARAVLKLEREMKYFVHLRN